MERVRLKSTTTVIPAKSTSRSCLHFLSNFDLLYSELFYDPMVFYFKAGSDAIDGLKASLSQVLVHYPVLAGRVKAGEDGRLWVDCNDEGIVVIEAVADARFDEWNSLIDCPLEKDLNMGSDTVIADYSSAPLLRIQLTTFQCGGLAIGYGWCHVCIDSPSAIHFMKSWFELHRGLTISSEPSFDSRLLKAQSPPRITHFVKDYISISKQHTTEKDAGTAGPSVTTDLQIRTFIVKVDAMNELLQEVQKGPWGYERPTSFECLAALCWKSMTDARNLADDALTTYSYPVDVRVRWQPSLASGFFGNATHLSCVAAKARDIKHSHLSYVAKLLRDDSKAANSGYLHSVVDFLQTEMDQGKAIGFNSDFYGGRDVQGTDFSVYPIYSMDFGHGQPLHYSFTLDPMFGDGIAAIFPTPGIAQEFMITISMAASHLQQLLNNPLFKRFLL
ncbi:hypothetical protein O6H91_05G036900 [Diphasiastrum complanatum]|uniref:Uncharacterized protein n=2 Tax=Diphasiastrum complanatum TaxID=34168 RepID=A0ACC2DMP5_DIPCM|nr:hypothetical protein O6H91_05G036900 [Diphasiastrum complanatum]KAJ7555426.1 hypothetical protein O6H91_05G036900 [Diphasiastrum complanatum]